MRNAIRCEQTGWIYVYWIKCAAWEEALGARTIQWLPELLYLKESQCCPLQETLCIAQFGMEFLWGENHSKIISSDSQITTSAGRCITGPQTRWMFSNYNWPSAKLQKSIVKERPSVKSQEHWPSVKFLLPMLLKEDFLRYLEGAQKCDTENSRAVNLQASVWTCKIQFLLAYSDSD